MHFPKITSWPRAALAVGLTVVIGLTFGALVGWNWLGIAIVGLAIAYSVSPLNRPNTKI